MRLHADVFHAQIALREMFSCPNCSAPKCTRAHMFAPKCRGPVTSNGAHLCARATQFQIPKKKTTSQRWRASPADSDVFHHYAKRLVKGKFEFSHVLRYHRSY